MATSTPWGPSQTSEQIARGIMSYTTAGHGGIHLSPGRRMEMPEKFRNEPTFAGGNWYEEDCDWALVAVCFPQYFSEKQVESAKGILRHYKPHLMQ